MSSKSLFSRIELLEKEISALAKVQAKNYFDVAVRQLPKADDYDINSEKLAELKLDLASAKDIAGNLVSA